MRLADAMLEPLALVIVIAELVQLHDDGLLVQDAQHDALAVDARQGHDAQIHPMPVDGEAEATVLGQAPLGDVQVGHDLHARRSRPRPCAAAR